MLTSRVQPQHDIHIHIKNKNVVYDVLFKTKNVLTQTKAQTVIGLYFNNPIRKKELISNAVTHVQQMGLKCL